jgi:hypothetical protein
MWKWIGIAAVFAALVVGDRIRLGRPDHKFRLSVEIAAPEGVRRGASVLAVHPNRGYGGSGTGGSAPRLKGEAAVVDLGQGRLLVALLAQESDVSDMDATTFLALRAFNAAGRGVQFRDLRSLRGEAPLAGDLAPVLIALEEGRDPSSARRVAPSDLGAGARVARIAVEMVPNGFWPLDFGGVLGEPVTRGIESRLPWLGTPDGAAKALAAAGVTPGDRMPAQAAFQRF